jgi:hypothetical protein
VPEYRSAIRSIFGGVPRGESYALITSYSDVIDFLKPSESGPTIELVFDSYRVEPEYISVARSLSGWDSKGESDALIAAKSEITDLLRKQKMIW